MKSFNKTTVFLILTFGISFSLAGIFKLFGGEYQSTGGIILAVVYMFIPMISAIIVVKGIHRENLKTNLFISFRFNKWFIFAWLVMPFISFGAFAIALLFPDVVFSSDMAGMFERFGHMLSPEKIEEMKESMDKLPVHPVWITLLQGLIAGATVNAIAGFGEELGWRGFLLREMKEKSFLKTSLIIGFIWGIWHSPLILMGHNYPQHPEIGVLMMTVWCILLSPLFLYTTIKSGSVIAASIMHGTLNATAGIALMLIDGGNDLTIGITGLAGFIFLILFLIGLFIYDMKISKEKIFVNKISKYLEV